MNESLELKKRIVSEFYRLKEETLHQLKDDQRDQQQSAATDDIDFADRAESPRDQIIEEASQKNEAIGFVQNELVVLRSIQSDTIHEVVEKGALVQTNKFWFFIGVATEPIMFEKTKVVGISLDSPLFLKMKGLKRNATFHYGDVEYVISNIS